MQVHVDREDVWPLLPDPGSTCAGSAVLFTATWSSCFLRCHLNWLHWAGKVPA